MYLECYINKKNQGGTTYISSQCVARVSCMAINSIRHGIENPTDINWTTMSKVKYSASD